MTAWVVRAGRAGEYEEVSLEEGIVSVGFSLMESIADFSDRDELREHLRLESDYEGASSQSLGKAVSQLWRFTNEIQSGDMVLLPRKSPKVVAVGRVTGSYEYSPGQTGRLPHTRKVEWLVNDIPRSNFAQDLRNSLGGLATVFQIKAYDAESRIDKVVLAHGKGDTAAESDLDEDVLVIDEDTPDSSLDEQIEDRIVQRIRERFSGVRLEYLVASILRASGYNAIQTRPGPDGGIDVVVGMGDMGFGEPRLCVQVKSGKTPVGLPEYNQLLGNVQSFGAQHGLLVSLSDFTSVVRKQNESSFFQIRLWGPDELVKRLLDSYDLLPVEIRSDIPLQTRRVLVESED